MPCDEGWQEHLKLRGVFLVDCRNDDEVVSKGRIAGALHWPCKMADDPTERVAAAASQLPYKSTPILAFCAVGGRSARFVAALRAAGYTNVANGGGFDAVSAARLPPPPPTPPKAADARRAVVALDPRHPISAALAQGRHWSYFHTHVVTKAIVERAVAENRSVEFDVFAEGGRATIQHPPAFYAERGLPPPSNMDLEEAVALVEASDRCVLVLDAKSRDALAVIRTLVARLGTHRVVVHGFAEELDFGLPPGDVFCPRWPASRGRDDFRETHSVGTGSTRI
jgi:rhodanese-related sulfurtransferase